MAENRINTRLLLKYDSYKNWVEKDPTLLPGEIAIAYLPPRPDMEHTNPAPDAVASATLIKVGPGQFNTLPWLSATAADVYTWAKEATLTINKDGTGNVVAGIEWDTTLNNGKGGIKYTTASVATSEGLQTVQEAINTINQTLEGYGDIVTHNVDEFVAQIEGSSLMTEEEHTKLANIDENAQVNVIEVIKVNGTAQNIDNKTVDITVPTENEIRGFAAAEINTLIGAADDEGGETIQSIANLVDYVEKNGAEIAQLVTDVATANTNASNAVTTANNANEVANTANIIAGEAKTLAEEAKEAATNAQNSASNSAAAAAESASQAAGSASTASEKAGEASASATAASSSASTASTKAEEASISAVDAANAKTSAETAASNASADASSANTAKQAAETAQSLAEDARDSAQDYAESASNAQTAAETAQSKAEAAQAAAEASNTSATAIANEAKSTAEVAKTASEAATEAINGLHEIATSGSIYDLEEVSTAIKDTNASATETVDCLIFYCGSASELV